MTTHLPNAISQKLADYHAQAWAPAWIEITLNTDIIQGFGGSWQSYFQQEPIIGKPVGEVCAYLQGMFPCHDDFELPQTQLREGTYTDIIVFTIEDSTWALFCDVTQNTLQLQTYQQAANELNLLKDQLNRTLDRYVGSEVADLAAKGKLQFNIAGERKAISTLFVDIRGFTTFNENHGAQTVMDTLNQYMNCMLTPILEEAGVVDKIIGDGVMAIFGIVDSNKNSVENAFQAATRIQQCVRALNKRRGNDGLTRLGVGVGVASGDAVLGILGSHDRRAFTAIGRHVNFAARLESNARAGEILLDEATLSSLTQPPEHTWVELDLKGIGKVHAYSILV